MKEHFVRRCLILATTIVTLAIAVKFLRANLNGLHNENLAPWPGQVIFGYYLAVLVLAIRSLSRRLRSGASAAPFQSLLLLVIVAGCADLVLNNIQEAAKATTAASYGPVILWDTATFLIWIKAIDLCGVNNAKRFFSSSLVATVPLWNLGREIFSFPYDNTKAYIDIYAENCALAFWLFICLLIGATSFRLSPMRSRFVQVFAIVVAFGCTYTLVAALGEILYLAYYPLHSWEVSALELARFPAYFSNIIYILGAVEIVAFVKEKNPWRLAERIGLRI